VQMFWATVTGAAAMAVLSFLPVFGPVLAGMIAGLIGRGVKRGMLAGFFRFLRKQSEC